MRFNAVGRHCRRNARCTSNSIVPRPSEPATGSFGAAAPAVIGSAKNVGVPGTPTVPPELAKPIGRFATMLFASVMVAVALPTTLDGCTVNATCPPTLAGVQFTGEQLIVVSGEAKPTVNAPPYPASLTITVAGKPLMTIAASVFGL